VLGMLDENGDAKAVPAAPPSASPSSSSSTRHLRLRGCRNESPKAEALAGAVKVARLKGRGKMAAAAAELGSLPQGSHVGSQTFSNASRAMEQLLFRLGGLETTGKALDSFFARPAVSVAMSTHLKSRTRIFNAARLLGFYWNTWFCCTKIRKERHRK